MEKVVFAHPVDFSQWRHVVRELVLRDVPPEQLCWSMGQMEPRPVDPGAVNPGPVEPDRSEPDPSHAGFTVSRALMEHAPHVLATDDPDRLALLYRLLWRSRQGEKRILDKVDDPDVAHFLRLIQTAAPCLPTVEELSGLSWAQGRERAMTCRRCDLWRHATQTVFGEGPLQARLMFVGEQPGDKEDLAGHPFVGPAGQLLDHALARAGIERSDVYITNTVKHFKFTPRGTRRIHVKPGPEDVAACAVWLDLERREIRPEVLVMLGATAASAVLGRPVTVGRERGRRVLLPDGAPGLVTVHPSYLLRLQDDASKRQEYASFVNDLRAAKDMLAA